MSIRSAPHRTRDRRRILIADDHAVARCGLRALLGTDPELDVVGEAQDGIEALALAGTLHPDLVLLDIAMPPSNGIEIAKLLRKQHPDLIVLFLTMHEDENLLHEALRVGAAGYLTKRAAESEILKAIHAATDGDLYVHPAMAGALLDHRPAIGGRRASPPTVLTPRERDVMHLLIRGNTNRQIAGVLDLSIRTVESHRSNLMGKLGLAGRVELIDYAEECGLLRTEGIADWRDVGSLATQPRASSGH